MGRGLDIDQSGGVRPPQSVRDATPLWAQEYAPKGGRPTKRAHEVVVAKVEEGHPPPRVMVKPPPPPPKASKVAKVAAQPPPPRP